MTKRGRMVKARAGMLIATASVGTACRDPKSAYIRPAQRPGCALARPPGYRQERTKTQSVELMNIYVANVPYSVKDQDLHELFSPFGEVTSAKIIMDRATNRSRGFGFVEMANDDHCLLYTSPSPRD